MPGKESRAARSLIGTPGLRAAAASQRYHGRIHRAHLTVSSLAGKVPLLWAEFGTLFGADYEFGGQRFELAQKYEIGVVLAERADQVEAGSFCWMPYGTNPNCLPTRLQAWARRHRRQATGQTLSVVALLAFGLLAGASGSAAAAPSVLRDKSRRAALRSQIPRSRFGRQAPAHDVAVRPCISQGFGCMPCKKRSGLSGPMGISSKLIICALPKGSFSSIS